MDNTEIEILRSTRTIAVVGLSSNPDRSSHSVAAYLQSQGYRIIPVNPKETEVLGEKAYARLEDIPEPVDCVNVFRRPEHVPEIVDAAIRIGAKALWLQQGITHESTERARAAGLLVVEDRCMYLAHRFAKHAGKLGTEPA
jgi:predicted CoA-binding protein